MDVSIIIVSYNTRNKTLRCIESVIEKTRGIEYEIIVVDNGSSDKTTDNIKNMYGNNVVLIEERKNYGFGKANNTGLKHAKGKYVLYLNSDTYLLNNAVKIMYDYYENNDDKLGALGAVLFDGNMEITHSYGKFPTYGQLCKSALNNLIFITIKSIIQAIKLEGKYIELSENKASAYQKTVTGEVDYITGADLFLKNDQNAIFDERFFMYCEEVDLQLRLKTNGLKRIVINGPQIVHDRDVSDKTFSVYKTTDAFKDISAELYAQKNIKSNPILLHAINNIIFHNCNVRPTYEKARKIINATL